MPCLSPFKKNPGCQCGPQNETLCIPCSIPKQDLVLSWTNPVYGNGSTSLIYQGSGWKSDCAVQMIYYLDCPNAGGIQFTWTYHSACPSAPLFGCGSIYGSTFPSVPNMRLDAYSCSPLYLRYVTHECHIGASLGYTSWTVTE
jgi:hypothetical protein